MVKCYVNEDAALQLYIWCSFLSSTVLSGWLHVLSSYHALIHVEKSGYWKCTLTVWIKLCKFADFTGLKRMICWFSVFSSGKFIMSASTDTTIHIWDLKGEVLASINTNQMTNSYAAISPCGRSVTTLPHFYLKVYFELYGVIYVHVTNV